MEIIARKNIENSKRNNNFLITLKPMVFFFCTLK